ncbi:MAG: protein kinase [Candidatus Gracilibacteria bacterium]|nr:protein kinase [Candidatus Gracilibacteria bacterium]
MAKRAHHSPASDSFPKRAVPQRRFRSAQGVEFQSPHENTNRGISDSFGDFQGAETIKTQVSLDIKKLVSGYRSNPSHVATTTFDAYNLNREDAINMSLKGGTLRFLPSKKTALQKNDKPAKNSAFTVQQINEWHQKGYKVSADAHAQEQHYLSIQHQRNKNPKNSLELAIIGYSQGLSFFKNLLEACHDFPQLASRREDYWAAFKTCRDKEIVLCEKLAQSLCSEASVVFHTAGGCELAKTYFIQSTEIYHRLAEICQQIPGQEENANRYQDLEDESRDKAEACHEALGEEEPDLDEYYTEENIKKQIRLGKYRIEGYEQLQWIDKGACGIVLKGYDKELDRWDALKVQIIPETEENRDKSISAIKEEARALAKMQNVNVLGVYRVTTDQKNSMVMAIEYIEGGMDLTKYRKGIDQAGHNHIEFDTVLRHAIDMSKGVAAIHKSGFIHRDIKNDNVLITKNGDCKIGDPGLAMKKDLADGTEEPAGTPVYMSHEAFYAGNGDAISPKVDVYALAMTLYSYITNGSPDKALSHAYGKKMNSIMTICTTISTEFLNNNNPGPAVKVTNPALKSFFGEHHKYVVKKVTERKIDKSIDPKINAMIKFAFLLEKASSQDENIRPTSQEFLETLLKIKESISESAMKAYHENKEEKSKRLKAVSDVSNAEHNEKIARSEKKKAFAERTKARNNLNKFISIGAVAGLALTVLGFMAYSDSNVKALEVTTIKKENDDLEKKAAKEKAAKERLEKMNEFIADTTKSLEAKQDELGVISNQNLNSALGRDWDIYKSKIDHDIEAILEKKESEGITAYQKITFLSLLKKAKALKSRYETLKVFSSCLEEVKNIKVNPDYKIEFIKIKWFSQEIEKQFGSIFQKICLKHSSLDIESAGMLKELKNKVCSRILLVMGKKIVDEKIYMKLYLDKKKEKIEKIDDMCDGMFKQLTEADNDQFRPRKLRFRDIKLTAIQYRYFSKSSISLRQVIASADEFGKKFK